MAIQGGDIISHLELDTGKYSAAMRAARADAAAFAAAGEGIKGRLDAVAGGLAAVGRAASVSLTVPIVSGFAAAGKAAISFESAFAGVRKTVDATEQEYARLNKSLLEMGREIPKTHEEMAGIMEIAGQLGVKQKDLESFTRTIADLSVATNLTEDAAASMLAQFANVVGMDLSNIGRLGSVIVDLGNNTATTERDIVEMAQRLSGAGALLKLTEAQIMGLSATMASLGINAEAGGSAMSRILQKMHKAVLNGGDALKGFSGAAGMSEEAFKTAFGTDPLKALIAFIGGLNDINEAGGNVYDVLEEVKLQDIRVTESILKLAGAGEQLEDNIGRANKAWQENAALTKEAEQRYKTTESRIKLAKNSIREAGITLGGAFLPVIASAAEKVAGLAQGLSDLDEESRNNITTGLGLTAAIGPASLLLKGLIGLLTGPGGVAAGIVLAAGTFALLEKASEKVTFAKLNEEMGSIVLSSEEIKAIVAEGFGEPVIDFTKVSAAREEAESAIKTFGDLQAQLAKDVYMAKMGVKPMSPEEIDARVGAVVEAAQGYLNKEENAAVMTVTAYFGEDSKDAAGIVGGIEKHMGGLRAQMAAKGKALGDALKNAIADGEIDAEEQGVIARLQRELSEIAARGTLIDAQSKADVLIAKAQYGGLTMESAKEGALAIEKWRKELLENYTKERDHVLEILAQQKNYGSISQNEYERSVANTFGRYGNLSADTAMGAMDLGWDMFGRQIAQNMLPKIAEAKKLMENIGGFSMDEIYENPEYAAAFGKLQSFQTESIHLMKIISPLLDVFEGVETELGDQMPESYKGMLSVFRQIKMMSQFGFDEMLEEGVEPTDIAEIDRAVVKRQEEIRERTRESTEGAADEAQKDMDAVEETVEGAAPNVKDAADKTAGKIPEAVQAQKEPTAEAAGEVMAGAAGEAGRGAKKVDTAAQNGLNDLPGAMGAIAGNAVNALVSTIAAGAAPAKRAGQKLGTAVEKGTKDGLMIQSPSKKMQEIGRNVTRTLGDTVRSGARAAASAGTYIAEWLVGSAKKTTDEAFKGGFADTMNSGRMKRPLKEKEEAAESAAEKKKTEKQAAAGGRGGSGGGGRASSVPYIAALPDLNLDTSAVGDLNARREQLLKMAGGWRAYYDKTEQEKALEAVEKKYKALIDAETEGFEALDSESQQAHQRAHQNRLNRIREQQKEETELVKGNYDLQKRLATDWLTAQGDILSAAFAKKQEQMREEDYQKNVADLEKRIRQTRSARERRELTEQLEQLRRDEAMRKEQEQLNSTLQGINALKAAVSAGVIGLNDLTGIGNIGSYGAGLKHVQGITAEQLATILDGLKSGGSDYGNHYTIDLSGAVIRDDSDIQRIVEGFERETRSHQRDFRNG